MTISLFLPILAGDDITYQERGWGGAALQGGRRAQDRPADKGCEECEDQTVLCQSHRRTLKGRHGDSKDY